MQDLVETGLNLFTFFRRQNSLISQHFCVGDTSRDIVAEESLVKADALGESFHPFVHG